MSRSSYYWKNDQNAPFASLLRVVHRYCPPEYSDWDRLKSVAQDPARYKAEDEMRRFKQELREALADPNQIPGNAAHQTLYHAAEYSDTSDDRFLRRLWRELYPNEAVPGGDEEFRSDLIAIARGESELIESSVYPYTEQYADAATSDSDYARMIWQQKYPDEPIPTE